MLPGLRPLALAVLIASASPAVAQAPACEPAEAADRSACASLRALLGDAAGPADPDSATADATARAAALRQSDPVFARGMRTSIPADTPTVAYLWTLGEDRRVVVTNAGDASAFVALPGEGVPAPLVPVFVSRDDAGRVPSLVALLDDDRATYGLRVPAHTTVAYRPAAPADVRPRGLDE